MACRHNPLISLPQEITLNIFSRLPAESVLDCKQVCRSWKNLLLFDDDNFFAYQHLQRRHGHGPHTTGFVAFDRDAQDFWYLEYHDEDNGINDKQPNYRSKMINIKFPADVCGGLVGSDNGLICLSVKTKYNGIPAYKFQLVDSPDEPLYICNPITREFVNLPRILIDEKKSEDDVHIVHGFGYHPLINEYKVVRVSYIGSANKLTPRRGLVEIYTLGSGSGWRYAGETDYYLGSDYFANPGGVCVNGRLHWLSDEFQDIVAFDLVDEKFQLLRTPTAQNRCPRRIFVAGHCLCIEYIIGDSLRYSLLKKNKEEDNGSSCHMNEQRYYKSWSWNTEVEMPFEVLCEVRSEICSITKMGKILLTDGREVDPYSREVLEFIGSCNFDFDWKVPLPHTNTFVSLEALGETNIKRFEL
ncbi:hypothetical protein MKW98_019154 [Papaver atlanticum]|uniref:F-box domain-containing protein n=1 Tax=Papaver atlanticum TaxID=357466 RepID=A0AAD4TIA1_9MAGN|nr:hypothetical protein MKW98_019154 [Papaver atlanticum]